MTVADKLINIIKDKPETCSCDHYRFKVENAVFWIANGRSTFRIDGRCCQYPDACLSLWDRCRLWSAYKWWVRNADMKVFIKINEDGSVMPCKDDS